MRTDEIRLLSHMVQAFPDKFKEMKGGTQLGTYDEIFKAISDISGNAWNQTDFDIALFRLINNNFVGDCFFSSIFSVQSVPVDNDNFFKSSLVFSDDAFRYKVKIKEITDNYEEKEDFENYRCPKCGNRMKKHIMNSHIVGKSPNGGYELGNDSITCSHIFVCPSCKYMESYSK